MTFLLLGALLIGILRGILSNNRLEKVHAEPISQLELKHQARLNSNTISHANQMIETLTCVARNEMII